VIYVTTNWTQAAAPGEAWWGFGIGCHGLVGQSELGAAALLKTIWWDLHLASQRMHLLWSPYVIGQTIIFSCCFFLLSFFSSPNLSGRRLDVYHTLAHGVALVRI